MRSMFFLARATRSAWMRANAEAFGRPDQNGASDTPAIIAGLAAAAALAAGLGFTAGLTPAGFWIALFAGWLSAAARIRAMEICRLRFTLPPREPLGTGTRRHRGTPCTRQARGTGYPIHGGWLNVREGRDPRAGRAKAGTGRARGRRGPGCSAGEGRRRVPVHAA